MPELWMCFFSHVVCMCAISTCVVSNLRSCLRCQCRRGTCAGWPCVLYGAPCPQHRHGMAQPGLSRLRRRAHGLGPDRPKVVQASRCWLFDAEDSVSLAYPAQYLSRSRPKSSWPRRCKHCWPPSSGSACVLAGHAGAHGGFGSGQRTTKSKPSPAPWRTLSLLL